jgi:hypothetical protein
MPLVYRAMRRDADGLPTVAQSASALGVRLGTDIDVNAANDVLVNDKGMSVAPAWRQLPLFASPGAWVPGAKEVTAPSALEPAMVHSSKRRSRPG